MKKKLHRIGNPKEPTIGQMLKMAENLATVCKKPSLVTVDAFDYYTPGDPPRLNYRIYVEGTYNEYPETWPKTIARYRKLMKGKKDGS